MQTFEEKSDYSIALMQEIFQDIKKLSEYSLSDVHNIVDGINKKIDYARGVGLNVDFLDKQVLDFRVILFKRDIKNKIEEAHIHLNHISFDISRIEKEYEELIKEKDIDFEELDKLIKNLHNELLRAKIIVMINNISNSQKAIYSIDQVINKLDEAKGKGIKVDDIEHMLMG